MPWAAIVLHGPPIDLVDPWSRQVARHDDVVARRFRRRRCIEVARCSALGGKAIGGAIEFAPGAIHFSFVALRTQPEIIVRIAPASRRIQASVQVVLVGQTAIAFAGPRYRLAAGPRYPA